jgi:hypothetical protein
MTRETFRAFWLSSLCIVASCVPEGVLHRSSEGTAAGASSGSGGPQVHRPDHSTMTGGMGSGFGDDDSVDLAGAGGTDESPSSVPDIMASIIGEPLTSEAGREATISIVLGRAPSNPVAFALSTSDPGEAAVKPPSVTFTADDWHIAQSVTITGVDDDIADGDVSYEVLLSAASSEDPYYAGKRPEALSFVNAEDDDAAGVAVIATDGGMTTEAEGRFEFQVVLASQPLAPVSIPLLSSDTSEGTVSPSSLRFTAADWNVKQAVTVTGINDDKSDGSQPFLVQLEPAVSGDPGYSGINAPDVSVTNVDDDSAGIVVSHSALRTGETGSTATFTIVLNSEPSSEVSIDLTSTAPDEGDVDRAVVVFTPQNWSTAQAVVVTGADDDLLDGAQTYTIVTAPTVSADLNYNQLDAIDINVINDDDESGVIVGPMAGTLHEGGGTVTFSLALASAPSADVSFDIASSDLGEATVDVSALTFTPINWNTPVTITVTGQDDAVVDGAKAVAILIGPTQSADPIYSGLRIPALELSNADNE